MPRAEVRFRFRSLLGLLFVAEPVLNTEIETDFGHIYGSETALGRSQAASGGLSGLPGAGKWAPSSGLQRICCILSKTAGLGRLHRMGWGLGAGLGLQSCPIIGRSQ